MTSVQELDLTAPRFRPKRYSVLTKDFYKEFRKKYPQYQDITDQTLRKIIGTHSELMWKTVIDERDGIEFPEGLGYIFIGSCPRAKKFNADHRTSLEKGVRMRHRNFESDEFLAKIFYTNYANKYKFFHRELWGFKGYRDFTREVSSTYPERWKMYLQVDNFEKISKRYQNHLKKTRILNKIKFVHDEYNEFDMN